LSIAAKLRADHNFRTPDAIEIVAAINRQADAFLANDVCLSRLKQLQAPTLADLTDWPRSPTSQTDFAVTAHLSKQPAKVAHWKRKQLIFTCRPRQTLASTYRNSLTIRLKAKYLKNRSESASCRLQFKLLADRADYCARYALARGDESA
jgi:hypothetical protein